MTESPYYPNLRDAILDNKGIRTQRKFAKLAGTNEAWVSNVICGRINPSEAQKEHWAGLLGVSKETLFKRTKSFKDYEEVE